MGKQQKAERKRWHALGLGLLLSLSVMAPVQAEPRLLDRIVAVVGSEAVMESELQQRLEQVRMQLNERGVRLPPADQLRQQVLDRLILDTIQLQQARQAGMRIDDQTLNATLNRIAQQNGLDLRSFSRQIEAEGLDFAQFREQIRQEMLIGQLRQRRVGERIQVSEQEINHYLSSPEAMEREGREFRVGHILLPLPENPTPEQTSQAFARAEALLERLNAGEDFQTLAVSSSSGDQALRGGDLGWRSALALPSLFADQVVTLRPGQNAGPFRSPSGVHLIQLLETRGGAQHLVQQTRARHLLVAVNALRDDAQAQAEARALHERIQAGESLAALARQYSDDPGSRQSGGELGWVSPGQMVPEFEQAMQQLAVGEVSQPVRSAFGWHVIQVEARQEADMTASHRRQQVRQLLAERRFEEEVEQWLREIRSTTWVEVRGG